MFGLGIGELLVILVIVLIIFGAGKLPEIGEGLGTRHSQLPQGRAHAGRDRRAHRSPRAETRVRSPTAAPGRGRATRATASGVTPGRAATSVVNVADAAGSSVKMVTNGHSSPGWIEKRCGGLRPCSIGDLADGEVAHQLRPHRIAAEARPARRSAARSASNSFVDDLDAVQRRRSIGCAPGR